MTASTYQAYLRCLVSQNETVSDLAGQKGWLLEEKVLRHRRAPGSTCLSALSSGRMGTLESPINNSKGCGGVMRVAPVGLYFRSPSVLPGISEEERDRITFLVGCNVAAITHGHPSGYLASGAFALIIARIIAGDSLDLASNKALGQLAEYSGHHETVDALNKAICLAEGCNVPPGPEAIALLGEGWVAEEALAIAVYCALLAGKDFARGVRLAVTHSGDSDSTGAIAGNILRALVGRSAIQKSWLVNLELRHTVEQMSARLFSGLDKV